MPDWNPSANDIFLEALEIAEPADRQAYIEQACGDDAELRAQVDSLITASQRAGSFLENPPQAVAAVASPTIDQPPLEVLGTRIGPYKLVEQIGEGGMGVVYMAQQSEPVERRVALKIIKPGMDTRHVIARFEAERQALSMMDHVNIARVLDAGATESGRPFFVMELVPGVPITKYCDDNRLTPRQRLELFLPVCHAIQHAHQKGIIHRDIKPSNVMVTLCDGKPVPKVIDFGVAKATEQRLTERTLITQYGTMIGTLEYMSPEQAEMSGLGVDTRSDIYSLGVLLYELLTGSTPLSSKRMKDAAFAEILRLIREEEPPRPSTRLSDSGEAQASISAQRHMEPARLTKLIRGELDWIVMKTLEKDRNRRYETASAFAADVQRYLADEPVQACPPSAAYRLRKFARRNKAVIATTAAIAVSMIIGIIGTTWQAIRVTHQRDRAVAAEGLAQTRLEGEAQARQDADFQRQQAEAAGQEAEAQRQVAEDNFRKARQAVDEYFTLVSESKLLDVPGLQPLRKQLLEAALRYYLAFANQTSDDPGVLADLASSYLRVGLIDQTIDRNDDAIEAFQQAMVIVERLRNQYPAATEQHCMLAGFWKGFRQTKAGTKLPTDPTEARRTLEKFTEFWEAFARENPAVTGFQSDLAAVYTYLGALLAAQHRKADALPFFYKARVIGDRLVHENPAVPEYRADLGRTCEQLADVLIDLGRNQEADELVGEALALREQVTTDSPGVPQRLVDLSESLQSLGDRLALSGRTQEAETAYRRAVDIRQKLAAERPDVPLYQERFAVTLTALAKLLKDNGRLPEAEDAYRQALVIAEKLAVDTPTEYYHHSRLGKVYTGLAELLKDTGRQREAEVAFRKAIAEYEQVIAQSPRHGWTLAQSCFSLGALLAAAGRHEDAEGAYRQAIQPLQRLLAASPDNWCRYDLAGAFYQVGILRWAANRPQEAVQAFRQAREEYEKLIAERSADSGAPMVFWLNNLAWLLATCPDANFRDHSRAVELATKGVELAPEWRCPWNTLGAAHYRAGGAGGLMPAGTSVWNTLGAALYRSGQWNAATDALQKSMETGSGGDGFDWFFLAMAYWHLGQKDEARKWYDRGAEWMQKNMPGDPELLPIRAEAADLMGITDPLSPEKHSPATEDQAP